MLSDSSVGTIKDEVRMLVDVRIETFEQPAPLTSFQLKEFHYRSQKISRLYQELNQIRAPVVKLRLDTVERQFEYP